MAAPVVRLVQAILTGAMNANCSDIHLEPHNPEMRVRYRVDGSLVDRTPPPRNLVVPLISRLKIMCSLDIAERRFGRRFCLCC